MSDSIDLNKSGIVSASIQKREEEYILITKRELEVIDTTRTSLNIGEKACIMFGNVSFGITGGQLMNPDKNSTLILILICMGIILNVLGFYFQYEKNKNMNKILKKI